MPAKVRRTQIRNPQSATRLSSPKSIRNALRLAVMLGVLSGCTSTHEASEVELQAVAALKKSQGALSGDKKGRLTRIDFGDRTVTEEDLVNAGRCARLDTLIIQGPTFNEDWLVHLQGLRRLAQLSLKNTTITDAGLEHVGKLTSLVELTLEDTKISDAGLAHLASLSDLKKLYLSGTDTTAAGVAGLKKSLPNVKVFGR